MFTLQIYNFFFNCQSFYFVFRPTFRNFTSANPMRYKIIDNLSDYAPTDQLLCRLPSWRREQAQKFRHEQGQRECALSYLLLSEMTGFQPVFGTAEHGKPFMLMGTTDEQDTPGAGERFFNISHCKAAIGCIVDSDEVGIDVECTGRYKERLAQYCMSDDELQQIKEAADPDALFTMLWTQKEALLKLTGEGITDDMKTCLSSARAKGVRIDSGVNREKGYAWSVAYREKDSNQEVNDI